MLQECCIVTIFFLISRTVRVSTITHTTVNYNFTEVEILRSQVSYLRHVSERAHEEKCDHNCTTTLTEIFKFYEDLVESGNKEFANKLTKNFDSEFEVAHENFKSKKKFPKIMENLMKYHGLIHFKHNNTIVSDETHASNRILASGKEVERLQSWLWFLHTIKTLIYEIHHVGLVIWREILDEFGRHGISIASLAVRISKLSHFYETKGRTSISFDEGIRQEITENHYAFMKTFQQCMKRLVRGSLTPAAGMPTKPIHKG